MVPGVVHRCRARMCFVTLFGGAWQIEFYIGADTKLALYRHRSARLLGKAMHHAQPHSRSLAHLLGGEERLEDVFERFFRDAVAAVRHAEHDIVAGVDIHMRGGYVVTNSHVVDGSEEIFVTLMDGTRLAAILVGGDPKSDLAVLKVEAGAALPALGFGDSAAMRVGSPVVALGNPFGLGHSASVGIISAKGRAIGAGPYDDFLQIDAPINPGNSGGPLFNAKGEVIGVNTAIFSPSGGNVGIGFAIPAALAEGIVADLMDDGKVERAWLGVAIQALSDDMAASLGIGGQSGAIVSEVMTGSPAAAGIARGDVILSVNDVAVKRLSDLTRTIASLEVGEKALLSIWRDGAAIAIEAVVGKPAEA